MTWHVISPAAPDTVFLYGLQFSIFFLTGNLIYTADHWLAKHYFNTCSIIDGGFTFNLWHYWIGFRFWIVALLTRFLFLTCGTIEMGFYFLDVALLSGSYFHHAIAPCMAIPTDTSPGDKHDAFIGRPRKIITTSLFHLPQISREIKCWC